MSEISTEKIAGLKHRHTLDSIEPYPQIHLLCVVPRSYRCPSVNLLSLIRWFTVSNLLEFHSSVNLLVDLHSECPQFVFPTTGTT